MNIKNSNGVVAPLLFFFSLYHHRFLLFFSFAHINVFFLEKSLKVSLFAGMLLIHIGL